MAISEIEKLERRYAENPKGLTFAPLAEVHRKNGDLGRALDLLRPGLEFHPDYIPASIVLGRCHFDLGDLPAAEAAFNHVLALDGEKLPGGLQTIYLPGVTTSEMALFTKSSGGAVLIGDALLNASGKGLQLLPDQYIEDKKQARVSLQKLLAHNFKIATFAHGDPLLKDAKKTITAFLKKRR